MVIITSNGEPLNKAHVRYLEHRVFMDAKRVNRIAVEYGRAPTESPLSVAAKAHIDDFLSYIYPVLPAVRFDFLSEQARPDNAAATERTPSGAVYFTFEVAM